LKLGIIAYAPVLDRLHPEPFIRNIKHWKTTNPIYWYSDYKGYDWAQHVSSPDILRKSKNKIACHNCLFLFGLRIAIENGLDKFLFLESDTRVRGDYWDDKVFSEAADLNPQAWVAGGPAIWNSQYLSPEVKSNVEWFIEDYRLRSGFITPEFRPRKDPDHSTPCIFIIGAGAVYNTKAMSELYKSQLDAPGHSAVRMPPFDLDIGTRTFRMFGKESVGKFSALTSVFSSFGDRVLNQTDRIALLKSGKVALIHQVKGDIDCL
jgi:hypothetical protein